LRLGELSIAGSPATTVHPGACRDSRAGVQSGLPNAARHGGAQSEGLGLGKICSMLAAAGGDACA